MYEAGDAEKLASMVLLAIGIIGLIISFLTIIHLLQIRISSQLTTLLLILLCITNGYAFIALLIALLVGTEVSTKYPDWINKLVCSLWHENAQSDLIMWLQSQVWIAISLDRLLAVVLVNYYKTRQKLMVIVTLAYFVLVLGIGLLENGMIYRYDNEACQLNPDFSVRWILAIKLGQYCAYLILTYITPAVVTVSVHGYIYYKLKSKCERGMDTMNNMLSTTSMITTTTIIFNGPAAISRFGSIHTNSNDHGSIWDIYACISWFLGMIINNFFILSSMRLSNEFFSALQRKCGRLWNEKLSKYFVLSWRKQ